MTRFVEEYCKDYNATKAAIRSGYSADTAHAIGWENLRKPEIKEQIVARLQELSLTAAETTKAISDIAKSSLNEFFTVKKVEHIPRIEIPLSQHIANLREELDFEEEFAARAGLDEKETTRFQSEYKQRELDILRYEMRLERNPDATIIVSGPTQWLEVAELDMVALVKAKEAGRIKSISYNQNGPKIELYAADAALRDLAKIHGLYEIEQAAKDSGVHITITESELGRPSA